MVGEERDEHLDYTAEHYPVTYTSNDGTAWTKHISSHKITELYTINGVLIGRNGKNVYIAKDDNGAEWELKLTTANNISDYFYYDNNIWFITGDWRFYSSSNGELWTQRQLNVPGGYSLRSAGFDDYNLVVATTEDRTIGVVPGHWLFEVNATPGINI